MLFVAIMVFGVLIGAAAQLILGRQGGRLDWQMAFLTGLVGSFVGGLLISLLSGDGISIQPSGIIGSLAGALLLTAGWQAWRRKSPTAP